MNDEETEAQNGQAFDEREEERRLRVERVQAEEESGGAEKGKQRKPDLLYLGLRIRELITWIAQKN